MCLLCLVIDRSVFSSGRLTGKAPRRPWLGCVLQESPPNSCFTGKAPRRLRLAQGVLWLVSRIANHFEARNSIDKTSTNNQIPTAKVYFLFTLKFRLSAHSLFFSLSFLLSTLSTPLPSPLYTPFCSLQYSLLSTLSSALPFLQSLLSTFVSRLYYQLLKSEIQSIKLEFRGSRMELRNVLVCKFSIFLFLQETMSVVQLSQSFSRRWPTLCLSAFTLDTYLLYSFWSREP